jgi:hypothetical protein
LDIPDKWCEPRSASSSLGYINPELVRVPAGMDAAVQALSGDNLRIGPNGQRICRACNAENQRAFRSNQAVQPLSSDP